MAPRSPPLPAGVHLGEPASEGSCWRAAGGQAPACRAQPPLLSFFPIVLLKLGRTCASTRLTYQAPGSSFPEHALTLFLEDEGSPPGWGCWMKQRALQHLCTTSLWLRHHLLSPVPCGGPGQVISQEKELSGRRSTAPVRHIDNQSLPSAGRRPALTGNTGRSSWVEEHMLLPFAATPTPGTAKILPSL